MMERFPYGKAPFWLVTLALVTTLLVLATQRWAKEAPPDLTLATFASNHMEAYQDMAPAFERKHGVKISLQLVQRRALQTRLQNAMLAGTAVPDLVEIAEGDIAFFTRGPLADVGFLDLTERLEREGYRKRLVEMRLSLWQSRRRVFALPHDVHPVMLAYRADILAELGIDPDSIKTWDDFVALRPKVVKDLDGDGVIDRYLIDLPIGEAWGLQIMMLQQGISLFDAEGKLTMDRPETVDTIFWYIHQVEGKNRIATQCGWGQALAKAQKDGLAVFFIAPDWRTGVMELEAPMAKGLFKLMPLPAWTPGGRRTAVWGGSGLAITRATKNPELAWELAKAFYFDAAHAGRRFTLTNIIPPLKDSWQLPEFKQPNAYFRGQAIGAEFAKLAEDVPASFNTPYWQRANDRLADVFLKSLEHYRKHGDSGLKEAITRELHQVCEDLEYFMGRNVLAKR
jgi:arabinosaccharide transport system substrate-binding protein